MPACPFRVGDVVRFAPSERTRGLYQNIERLGIAIGEEAKVTDIRDDIYLSLSNGATGWPWNEFVLVSNGDSRER